jgi:hypothetical protein
MRDVLHQRGFAGARRATIRASWPLPIGATMSITLVERSLGCDVELVSDPAGLAKICLSASFQAT